MREISTTISHLGQPQRLIRIKEMLKLIGISRATLHRWIKSGSFPQPKEQNGRALGWTETQYSNWLSTQ